MEESSSGGSSFCGCLDNFLNWIKSLVATLFGSSTDGVGESLFESPTDEVDELAPIRHRVSHDELIESVAQCFQRDCERINIPYPVRVVTKVSVNGVRLNVYLGTIEEAPAIEAYRQAFRERLMPILRQVDLETEANQNLMVLSVGTHFYHNTDNLDENYSIQSFPHEINYVLGRPQPVRDLVEGHHDNIPLNTIRFHIQTVVGQDRNLRRSLQELLISNPLER